MSPGLLDYRLDRMIFYCRTNHDPASVWNIDANSIRYIQIQLRFEVQLTERDHFKFRRYRRALPVNNFSCSPFLPSPTMSSPTTRTKPGHARHDTALIHGLSASEVQKLAETCIEAKGRAYCERNLRALTGPSNAYEYSQAHTHISESAALYSLQTVVSYREPM